MEEVEQLVPQERVQQRTFGVGAVLVSGLDGLEQLVPQERVQQRTYGVGAVLVSGLLDGLEQLVPQERVQIRTFGVGAVLVSGLLDGLEQVVPQERVQPRTGEHVHAFGEPVLLQRVQQLTAEQVAYGFHVPQHRAQQRSEQVDDVHAPLATASDRNVQQLVDDLFPLRTIATTNC